MTYYLSLSEVSTEDLDRQLGILEEFRDYGLPASKADYDFFYEAGIPMLSDEGPDALYDWSDEVLAVLGELSLREFVGVR